MKLNFYRKFQFSRNFQVTEYFDNSETAFLMAGFHIKIHDMAGKQCVFFCPHGWKTVTFSETVAGISTLTLWTPCAGFSFVRKWFSRK